LFQNTSISGSKSVITFFEAHNNAIFDVAWVPGSQSQVTVSPFICRGTVRIMKTVFLKKKTIL
jgi:hypothetical protein